MGQDFTTTAFLASLKRRGMLPSTAETFATADFLAIATEELQTYCMETLVSIREEYGVADYDVDILPGVAEYALPERAIGDKVRNVLIQAGNEFVPLSRIEPERRHQRRVSGAVSAFLFEDNSLVLVPTPTTGGVLRVKYFRRPSALVQTPAVATISAIDSARTVITTASTIPTAFTTSIKVDVVGAKPGFRVPVMDATTVATTSGTTITLSTALPTSVVVGDYVCLAGESPVPQIPVELHPLLAQRTKAAILEALGDPKADTADAVCERMRKRIISLLSPRSEGSPRPVINYHGPGFARGRGGRWRIA